MNVLWFVIAAIVVPALVAALTLLPDRADRKRRREWDEWAKREREKHAASQAAKAEAAVEGWDTYSRKGRRL